MTETDPPSTIGVAGAGTMGAGIAQLSCQAGTRTLLYDPDLATLDRAAERIAAGLRRSAERGRIAEPAETAIARLQTVDSLAALEPCELVIEAAPESLQIKHELFEQIAGYVAHDCVLATNTSSLLVTAVATPIPHPERVVGMHFFNPPPVMELVEVVAGAQSAPEAVALARATGAAMGRHVIEAADGIGFLVNRCNRPFGLEALKLLSERVATVEQIDLICRQAGGFRMGPFELMDLVGVDTGLDIARSFYQQSFGEPRWRPSPIAVKTVAAGRLGRKSGRGYYRHPDGERHRPDDPEPAAAGGGDGLIVVAGSSQLADELVEAAQDAGWQIAEPTEAQDLEPPFLILDLTGDDEPDAPLQGGPQAICLHASSLAAIDPAGASVGFHALPPLSDSRLVELTAGPDTPGSTRDAAERFFGSLGKHTAWVGDAPGLVLGRIVCQVINEAAFALGEGIGSAHDIDAGMVHGLNYPRGILGWADRIGLDHVVGVLEALHLESGEERYRIAPRLRQLALSGRLGVVAGEGFFTYE